MRSLWGAAAPTTSNLPLSRTARASKEPSPSQRRQERMPEDDDAVRASRANEAERLYEETTATLTAQIAHLRRLVMTGR